jgi:hypothetical protein
VWILIPIGKAIVLYLSLHAGIKKEMVGCPQIIVGTTIHHSPNPAV